MSMKVMSPFNECGLKFLKCWYDAGGGGGGDGGGDGGLGTEEELFGAKKEMLSAAVSMGNEHGDCGSRVRM